MHTFSFYPGDRPVEVVQTEVRQAVETEVLADVTDPDKLSSNPSVGRYGGAVTWTPINVRSPGGKPPQGVESPLAIKAGWEDNSHSGDITVYRRVAGEFRRIDRFLGPAFGYTAARDYALLNYGIEPEVGFGPIDSISLREDERFPWLKRPPSSDHAVSLLGEDSNPAVDALLPLLEDDPWYHPAAAALRRKVYQPDAAVFDQLESESQRERSTAVRKIGASASRHPDRSGRVVSDLHPDRYRQFVAAVPETDSATQRLVTPLLWRPPLPEGTDLPDASLALTLARAYDSAAPAARAGALTGAARVIGKAFESIESPETSVGSDQVPDRLEQAVRTLFRRVEEGLEDDHRYVRFRAAGLVAGELTMDSGDWVFLRDDELWYTAPFESRWRLATAAAELSDTRDYEGGPSLLVRPSDDWPIENVYDGDPETLPVLVEYGWDTPGPRARVGRSVVADAAEDDPSTVVEYLDRPIEAIRDGDPTPADLRMVAALATEAPGEVADIVSDLVTLLDEDDDRRREAARALSEIGAIRPDAVGVDEETLSEAAADIMTDDGRLVSDRLAPLAAVDAELAGDMLEQMCARVAKNDGRASARLGGGLLEASDIDETVVINAKAGILPLIEIDSVGDAFLEPAGIALLRGAIADPDSFVDWLDTLALWVGADAALARDAAATAIATIGETAPSAVPSSLTPLLDHSDQSATVEGLAAAYERSDNTPDSADQWPLGVLASEDPAFVAEIVVDAIDTDMQWLQRRTELLEEVYAAGDSIGDEVLGHLLRSAPTAFLGDRYGTGAAEALFDESPERAAAMADELVGLLAGGGIEYWDEERDRRTSIARTVERTLRDAAEQDPDAVREAIETHYESVDAFVDSEIPERKAIKDAVSS